jgi:ATP-dependent protease Clp ATPase subunit
MSSIGRFVARSIRGPEQPSTVLSCSFCGATQWEAAKLIAGPAVYVCDRTVRLAQRALANRTADEDGHVGLETIAAEHPGTCGFCGKSDRPLVQPVDRDDPPRICDECLDLCEEIIAEEGSKLLPEDP